jgi:phosphoglycolate phosphatase-like HAD superfamily hydrolase
LLPGSLATLSDLAGRGFRLSIASNKPARFANSIADQFGLTEHLVAVHGPDTVGSTKPDPAMLDRCMADMRTDPAHGLYVGDMVLDVESAARAALPVVLVAGGSSSPGELQVTGCRVIRSIDELLPILPRGLGAP